jgi:hypothetical protein
MTRWLTPSLKMGKGYFFAAVPLETSQERPEALDIELIGTCLYAEPLAGRDAKWAG